MIKFFHQAFFLWRTPWGRQWIIIWHANIQSKEKKNSISFKQTHISQKGAIYSNVYLYLWKNREKESQRTKMKTNNFSIHICKILSQQTGSLEKQISTKPNAWPSLPVCLFVCLFVLSLVNFYLVILASFPLLDYCWNGGWDGLHQPMATAKDCTLKSPSFWIYIHTREMRVYMCSSCFWFTLTAWAWLLTIMHSSFWVWPRLSLFLFPRQLHWNEHFAFWLVPVLLLFSAYRLRQISSKLFSYSSLCLSSALNCSAACQKMLALSISLTECAFPHLSNHQRLNVSSEH